MLNVIKLDPRATLPTCANPGEDLAWDLYALEDAWVHPRMVTTIYTGIAAHFTSGIPGEAYGLLVRERSSHAKIGMRVLGGVIDAGYRSEIRALMIADESYVLPAGSKIAQMVPMRVYTGSGVREVDALPASARGDRGWGSSGR